MISIKHFKEYAIKSFLEKILGELVLIRTGRKVKRPMDGIPLHIPQTQLQIIG